MSAPDKNNIPATVLVRADGRDAPSPFAWDAGHSQVTSIVEEDDSTPDLGKTIADRFELRDVLGQSAAGVVYKARDRENDQHVAFKIYRPCPDGETPLLEFRAKTRAVAVLKGAHNTPIHYAGLLPDGRRFVIMDLVRGETLATVLARGKRLPTRTSVIIACHVLEALSEAHLGGIVHGAIRPANIMLVMKDVRIDTRVIGYSADDHGGANAPGKWQNGVAAYKAPEQFDGNSDAKSDLYSLAIVLHEMLVGQVPFEATSALGWATAHNDEPVRSFRRRARISEDLETIVRRSLEKARDDRFADAREMYQQLVEFLGPDGNTLEIALDMLGQDDPEGLPGEPNVPAAERDDERGAYAVFDLDRNARRRWIVLGAIAAVLVIGGAALFALWPSEPPPAPEPIEPARIAIGEPAPPPSGEPRPKPEPKPEVPPPPPSPEAAHYMRAVDLARKEENDAAVEALIATFEASERPAVWRARAEAEPMFTRLMEDRRTRRKLGMDRSKRTGRGQR